MQDLEKLYKDKLENHSSPVSSEVWDNIAMALKKQKYKRRLYLLYLTVLALALFIILIFVLTHHNTNDNLNDNKTPKNDLKTETASISQLHASNSKLVKLSSKNATSVEKNKKTIITKDKSRTSNVLAAKKTNSLLSLNPNTNNLVTSNTQNISPNSGYNTMHLSRHPVNKSFSLNRIPLNFKSKRIVWNSTPRSVLFGKNTPGILNDCFPVNRNYFMLEAYFSSDYNRRVLSGENYEFLKQRNETERNLYSYSMGLMIGYLLNNGLNIKTGINYTTVNEKFNITFRKVISTQTIITIDSIMNGDGTFTEVRDTSIKEIYGERNVQEMNSYKMVDVPLILGLTYKKFNHRIGISTGVIFNIISRQKGVVLNHAGDNDGLIHFGSDNSIFRKNIGISIYAGMSYSYRLLNRYEIFVEPNIRYYLKSFTKANYLLDQNYTKYGIAFGTRYIF